MIPKLVRKLSQSAKVLDTHMSLNRGHDKPEARINSDEYIRHMAAIVEFSDDAIVSKSLTGIIKTWNRGAERMFGFSAAEMVGKNISMLIPKESIDQEKDIIKKIINNETIDHYETVRIKKNGDHFFVSITVSPLRNKEGRIIGVSKIARDVTSRKNAEADRIRTEIQLTSQKNEIELRAGELLIANNELLFQNHEKASRAAELVLANDELIFQNLEKEKRAAELLMANKQLAFQNEEKEKRAAELNLANIELIFQNKEKEKRAVELFAANSELAFQNDEKEKRAAELAIANKELAFQNEEKGKRAVELGIANQELFFQNEEKRKRAAELKIANTELTFQNKEKEKRAGELISANEELLFQNHEKEKRAEELFLANEELAFRSEEKGKREAELIIANEELAFQNLEKEKRAGELVLINKELAFKEIKLKKHNKALEQFAYVASHDLQEPLRTVSNYMQVFEEDYVSLLDDKALGYLRSVNRSTERMSILIKSLLEFSRLGQKSELKTVDCKKLIDEVVADLNTLVVQSDAVVRVGEMPVLTLYEVEIRQLFQNLIINAIKFRRKGMQPEIDIRSSSGPDGYSFAVTDNGIGIDPAHFDRIFQIFQRLPSLEKVEGNGIGLANCMKIVQLHEGELWVESVLGHGATFHFTLNNLITK